MLLDYWLLIMEYWVLSIEYWVLIIECWVLSIDCWFLIECWLLSVEYCVLSSDYWVSKLEKEGARLAAAPAGEYKLESFGPSGGGKQGGGRLSPHAWRPCPRTRDRRITLHEDCYCLLCNKPSFRHSFPLCGDCGHAWKALFSDIVHMST